MIRLAVLFLILLPFAVPQRPVQRIRDVHKLYVGDFGNSDAAKTLRERVKARLTESKRFDFADVPERADAVLAGDVEWHLNATFPHAKVALRLMNANLDDVWKQEFEQQDVNAQALRENLAKESCKLILKAIEKDDKAR